ncbi:SCO2523 family variant P-loop protein [Streptomyces sp. NBC_00237]|uniref:SCO2523 family variant P-loop protein n=1 Tax=Streptomyces sp. NBC_00237 TaxID=2975687 RepID=UPI0022526773|nr:SCO2523 family variant P-loop protein [Streptomyces sp. NBC_00237]MCX5201842.1 SCO2523 family variant P-loop protein [Streptomyces sp. NBC_00237]
MLVFAASDKGGTGRSVTSANLAYRRALRGDDVCYLDFDFGSPTAAAVFDVPGVLRGAASGGLHSYLRGAVAEPLRIDVWDRSEHDSLRYAPAGAGRLVLVPGDLSGGEFVTGKDAVNRCTKLFARLDEEFDLVLVDLSAGRSFALDMALESTVRPELRGIPCRWLVFHRWTRQHILAAAGLVYGERGVLAGGAALGHDPDRLRAALRFVRAVVPGSDSPAVKYARPPQAVWMHAVSRQLNTLAAENGLGHGKVLGSIPEEPVLKLQEQLITDEDVLETQVANPETRNALEQLARRLVDDSAWEEF